MIIDLLNRYLKIFVLLVILWTLLWTYNNVGCGAVEGEEMVPSLDQNSLHLVLSEKRLPPDVSQADVVFFRQNPGKGEQKEFFGKVYAGPGDVVWVERKIVSEKASFLMVIHGTTLCHNQAEKERNKKLSIKKKDLHLNL